MAAACISLFLKDSRRESVSGITMFDIEVEGVTCNDPANEYDRGFLHIVNISKSRVICYTVKY